MNGCLVSKTHKKMGEQYPPKTVVCTQWYPSEVRQPQLYQLKDDLEFATFNMTPDIMFKTLRSNGVGVSSAQTKIISTEEEAVFCTILST